MKNNFGTLSFIKGETKMSEEEINKLFEDIVAVRRRMNQNNKNLSLKEIISYFGEVPMYEESIGKELKKLFPKR